MLEGSRELRRVAHLTRALASSSSSPLPPPKPPVYPNKRIPTLDVATAFVEFADPHSPARRTLVFLHGNPTSSYLWRNVIARVADKRTTPLRLLAPDLVNHGKSDPSKRGLGFAPTSEYLDAWFEAVLSVDERPILVLHDWGSALGFHWAARHLARVAGIVHMESLVAPFDSWDDFPASGRGVFRKFREEPGAGEAMILDKNFFVERLLLGERKDWSAEDLAAHRERFGDREARRALLAWPRDIPIRGTSGPKEVIELCDRYADVVGSAAHVPKLFVDAEPGFFSPFIRRKTAGWRNHEVTPPVRGAHFVQETDPVALADHVLRFLERVPSV